MEREIEFFTDSNSCTVFWKKTEKIEEGDQFQIYLDGVKTDKTEKTYYHLEGLRENQEYQIEIKIVKKNQLEKTFGQVQIQTKREKRKIDVTKEPYGAVGDGRTLNTRILQRAIDDCKEDEVVYFPVGTFLTGALRLHSDMELYLEKDAILQGTDCPEDYLPRIKSRFEGHEMECYSSLLNLGELDHTAGYNCKNVIINGKGTIASGGKKLAERIIRSERENLKEYIESLGEKVQECENLDTIPGRVRPRLINISNCQNIRLTGLTLMNGASWNIHMIYSDKIITNDCVFRSEGVWNGDGWDPDSSRNCTIFNCTFYTGDDSIAIKSGKNPEGNEINRPCEQICIFNCVTKKGHGFAMGSEMSGGIKDVYIWDCDLSGSRYGIEIKGTKKRGGYVRDIKVRDCIAPRIMVHSVAYNDDGISAKTPPVFENFELDNLLLTGKITEKDGSQTACDVIELCGFDEPGYELKNVKISNLNLEENPKISLNRCEDINIEIKNRG